MNNNFTKNDIKNSIEYKFKAKDYKISIFAYILFFLLMCCCIYFSLEDGELKLSASLIYIMSALLVICIAITIGMIQKANYILKNYQKFNEYEVKLQFPRYAMNTKGNNSFFRVLLDINGTIKVVDTDNFSTKKGTDLMHKRVVGLYDEDRERFYIIKIIRDLDPSEAEWPEEYGYCEDLDDLENSENSENLEECDE